MSSRAYTATLQTGFELLLQWDAAVLRAISRLERRGLLVTMRALTRAGDSSGWIAHGAVLLVAGVAPSVVAAMASAALLGTAASQLAKRLFRRGRPAASIAGFTARGAEPDPFSFPSGHSTVAFSVATAAMACDPRLGGIEVALASAIAFSRVVLGAHYPVDVIGGLSLGFVCGLASWSLFG